MDARCFNLGLARRRNSDARAPMLLPPRLPSSSVTDYSGSLQEFKYFPKLPSELRSMIYRIAMLQPRIIELRNCKRGGEIYVCVSQQSTIEPPLMQACFESRRECRQVYKLRRFDNLPEVYRLSRDRNVWWNPEIDIIYLGTSTCHSTTLQLCEFSYDHGAIPRVALTCEIMKCRWDCDDCKEGGTPDQPPGYYPPSIIANLHGYKSAGVPDRFGGCVGLEELLLVVESRLWVPSVGPYTSFRHATSNGLQYSQIHDKAAYIGAMDSLKVIPEFSNVGRNRWLGDRSLDYRFVSFAPIGYGNIAFDALTLTEFNFERLGSFNVQELERRTGCNFILPNYELPGDAHSCIREVGLCGSKESILEAKKEIARCIFYAQVSGREDLLADLAAENEHACLPCVQCRRQ